MKKTVIFILLFGPFAVFSQSMQVSVSEAEMAARQALRLMDSDSRTVQTDIVQIFEKSYGNYVAMYEVTFETGESVIISGNKATKPILAYYHDVDGYSWLQNIDERKTGFTLMLNKLFEQIGHSFSRCSSPNATWNDLSSIEAITNRAEYGPYLKTLWRQKIGNNCGCKDMYNKYMPLSGGDCAECHGEESRYPAGCTITAWAQIMNYWKHPVLINDTEQIDWCNMPIRIDCNESTDEQIEAVARLYKILGDALGTSYGTLLNLAREETDITIDRCFGFLNPEYTENEMHNLFGYSSDMRTVARIWYTNSRWKAIIKREIIDGKPVLYWAIENNIAEGAHTFVCDGYNSATDMFHFNWGQGEGAWCSIDSIAEDTNQQWTLDECAMINIKPETNSNNICNTILDLGLFYYIYYSGHILNYNSNTPSQMLVPKPIELTPQTMTILESAPIAYREEFRTISPNERAVYRAHEEIGLQDGFLADSGCDCTAKIEPCERCEERDIAETEGPAYDTDNYCNQEIAGDSEPMSYAKGHTATKEWIHPNPTDRLLTAATDGEVDAIIIYTIDGRPVGGWRILSLNDEKTTLDVNSLADGAYILTVHLVDGTIKATRFIKKG